MKAINIGRPGHSVSSCNNHSKVKKLRGDRDPIPIYEEFMTAKQPTKKLLIHEFAV